MTTSSFGPTMQLGALLKMIGSAGIGAPVSAGVVGVVEADGDEIADVPDARPDSLARRCRRQRRDVGGEGPLDGAGGEGRRGDIPDDARDVANFPVGVENARLLVTGLTESDQFHVRLLPLRRFH